MARDDYLRKVRALLARANHPATPGPEAESALKMATKLMDAHAIEQWEAAMGDDGKSSLTPVRVDIDITWWYREQYEMRYPLWNIWSEATRLCRVVFADAKVQMIRKPDGTVYEIPCFGLQSDIDYLQMLFTDLYIQMSDKIRPKYDPNKSLGENVYIAKEAGMKYGQIALWAGHPEWITEKYRNGRYVKEYNGIMIRSMKKYAKDAGLEVHKEISLTAYREDFCSAFGSEVRRKLRAIRTGDDTPDDNSMAIALRDIENVAREAMYDEFNDLRPHPADCQCDTCHVTKCRDPKCQRSVCIERRKPLKRRGRVSYSSRGLNYTALSRGAAAGKEARITSRGGGGLKKQREIE